MARPGLFAGPVLALTLFAPVPAGHRVDVEGGQIDVVLPDRLPTGVSEASVLEWIEASARGVAAYMGGYPVPRVRLTVRLAGREAVGSGVTFGGPHPSIRIALGPSARDSDLHDDWVLPHEMTHLAFPDLSSDDAWAEEGLSTYVEPLARIRAGTQSEEVMWKELVEGLPQGVAKKGDGGLHGTHEWGRTYWGGALFWLLADIELHQATHGRQGLADALRAILDAGGDIRARWTLTRTLDTADHALGVDVLANLYRRQGAEADPVDLPALWRRLGIHYARGHVDYDDHAPLADVRRAIGRAPGATRDRADALAGQPGLTLTWSAWPSP
jgi:hypothetical protein